MNQKPIAVAAKPALRLRPLISALTLGGALSAPAAQAADNATEKALAAQMQQVLERMRQLEQRNQELERRVQELSKAVPPPSAVSGPDAGQWGAARDARLVQVEKQQQDLKQEVKSLVRPVEAPEGADEGGHKVEASVVAVMQRVNRAGSDGGRSQGRINYRGDVLVTVPAGSFGEARGSAVGQLRFGQGGGVTTRPTHTGAVNSTTFEAAAGSDQTYAVVAQAYYQVGWPLDGGRFNDQAGDRIELTVGKIDLFGFFDQNAVAGDEGAQFLNNVFVHNPLLDSGGDIGADSFGFAPGVRLGWFTEGERAGWGASLGVFASGAGSTFSAGPHRPLVIGQVEYSPKQINGEPRGNYRAYAWTNGRTTDLDGADQRHTGFGLSADQRFGRDWNLFARYGRRTSGDGNFDSAITLGFEHGGRAWGRGKDAVGVAFGLLKTGSAWRNATADGTLAGYAASGNEQIAEVYYRLKLGSHLEISPDFQLIRRAGGDDTAPAIKLFGVRASLGF
jgi:high affinity Mn2+ porin